MFEQRFFSKITSAQYKGPSYDDLNVIVIFLFQELLLFHFFLGRTKWGEHCRLGLDWYENNFHNGGGLTNQDGDLYTYILVKYNISLTSIKAIWGWFPLL